MLREETNNDTASFDARETEGTFDSVNRLPTEVVEILIYLLCLCTGGPLNLISFARSLHLYIKDRRQRSQILLLRLHLNIADLLTMFIYTPTQIIWMSTFQWYGGDLLCRLCKFFYTFSFYLNSFVIAAIAVDRARSACRINSINTSKSVFRQVKCALVFSYTAAIIFSIPQVFIFHVFRPSEAIEFRQCAPVWTIYAYEYELNMQAARTNYERHLLTTDFLQIHRLEKMYNITHLLLVFWIPTTVIACSYMVVIFKLNSMKKLNRRSYEQVPSLVSYVASRVTRSNRSSDFNCEVRTSIAAAAPSNGAVSIENVSSAFSVRELSADIGPIALQTLSKASRIAKRQAALILVAYLTLWSPYNILAMMNTLTSHSQNRELILDTLPFLNALIVVNPVINPVIYGLFQRN